MQPGPILAIDCGSVWTKVALFDVVDGIHRLIARALAPSTHAPPVADVTVGALAAIEQVGALVGRDLTRGGALVRQGQPLSIVACTSVAPPPRVALVAPAADLPALSSAVAAAGCAVAGAAPIDAPFRAQRQATWELAQLAVVERLRPQVAVVAAPAAPHADRARSLAQLLVAAGANLEPPRRLVLVGPGEAFRQVDAGDLQVVRADGESDLRQALARVYAGLVAEVPGMRALAAWLEAPLISTVAAECAVAALSGARNHVRILVADVGASSTLVVRAIEDGSVSVRRVEGGAGPGAPALLRQAGAGNVARWLPVEVTEGRLWAEALRVAHHPTAASLDPGPGLLAEALAREALRLAVGTEFLEPAAQAAPAEGDSFTADRLDILVATGGVLGLAAPAAALQAMLDALQPRGLCQVAQDSAGILSLIGAVAGPQPDVAAGLFERDCLANLGTCIAPTGWSKDGAPALDLTVEGGDAGPRSARVAAGSLRRLPLRYGERIAVKLYPAEQFDVGLGRPGAPGAADVEGGLRGVVVDCRGRPIRCEGHGPAAAARVGRWLREAGVVATS